MLRTASLLCAWGLLWPYAIAAQRVAPRTPAQVADSVEIRELAVRLTRRAATDSARAAAIYEWVARNVSYDVDSYRRGALSHIDPESVYRHRKAVCRGFVALYGRLAAEAGLSTVIINGYAKGFDYVHGRSTRKPNHSWLAVSIAGKWRLVDPTWAAGVVVSGRFQPQFSWDFFLADPEVMVLSHLPEDVAWQLVARPLRRAEFERLPVVPHALLEVGFAADAIRAGALQSRVRDFPAVGVPSGGARVVHAPISGTIRRSAKVPVQIEWPGAVDVALVTGDVWTPLTRAGDVFHGEAVAAGGSLYVVGRAGKAQPYQTLLLYQVN